MYEVGGLARDYTNVRECMADLQKLSMREVRKRAFAEGLVEDDLDEALDDADELGVVPKDSIIAAILRKIKDDPVPETRKIGLHPEFFNVAGPAARRGAGATGDSADAGEASGLPGTPAKEFVGLMGRAGIREALKREPPVDAPTIIR
jgi:hypothetical protein